MPLLFMDVDKENAAKSQMREFLTYASAQTGKTFASYNELHNWACANLQMFWGMFLSWSELLTSGSAKPALTSTDVETAKFFPSLRLNYAQNLLRSLAEVPDSHPAIFWWSEDGTEGWLDRGGLRRAALAVGRALTTSGIGPEDRVVAVVRNSAHAVKACLGTAAIGAVWSSVAPDLGTDAVLARFSQLQPKVLFADLEYQYQGRRRDIQEHISTLVKELHTVRILVITSGKLSGSMRSGVEIVDLSQMEIIEPLDIEKLDGFAFDHPLFILFTSGTTGAPKCIVHGAGGTLIEQIKEHKLHNDLRPSDRFFFLTSCGWMIWNWQLSALAVGTPIMLFEGSASYPEPAALLRMIDKLNTSVLGLSPAYLQLLKESGTSPRDIGRFNALRLILSSGSVLNPSGFDWLRDHVKYVPIHSICGGTDIMGAFVLGNPLLPIYTGETQCISLALDVRVAINGRIERTGVGDLVCVAPFPSRPIRVWGDNNNERYHSGYFAENAGVWTHGDHIELTGRGSARVLGRSDGVMKISGVRIGPSEIYAVVLQMPDIVEAMAVVRESAEEVGGASIALLLVLASGRILDRQLILRIQQELLSKASRNHVPELVLQVKALPQTHNGKYSERAARDIINGRSPPNRAALRNPECLDELATILRQHFATSRG